MLAAVCRISKGKMGTSGYVSRDGGLTWTRVVLPEGAAKVSTGWDAIAYFDGKGNAFYGANDGAGLWITRSSDEGRTWSDATLLLGAEGFDRQYMGFDRTGRWAGRIYAGASVESLGLDGKSRSALAISFSDDGGKTFGQPYLFTSTPDERIFTFVNMVVTPDGKVILPFLTMPERVMPDWTLWDSHDEIKSLPDYSMSLRVATSDDGGKSYSISPRVTTYRIAGSDRFRAEAAQGNGNTAIDLSDGPFRGRIYTVGLDHNEDRIDVHVAHSCRRRQDLVEGRHGQRQQDAGRQRQPDARREQPRRRGSRLERPPRAQERVLRPLLLRVARRRRHVPAQRHAGRQVDLLDGDRQLVAERRGVGLSPRPRTESRSRGRVSTSS